MRKLVVVLVALMPVLAFAWPQPGDPAPEIYIADTAWQAHAFPTEWHGSVVAALFWQST